MLKPVIGCLAPGGQLKVVQSLCDDPAHDIVRRVWPDQPVRCVSRHQIVSALRKSLGAARRDFSFSGLTDARSLFRFDMHTLPTMQGEFPGTPSLSLQSAWNNAVFFVQVKEDVVQAAMREDDRYLRVTRDVLVEHGGLWFVNETLSVSRKHRA